jgi:transcriptional regulator with XRE-family HTH domain
LNIYTTYLKIKSKSFELVKAGKKKIRQCFKTIGQTIAFERKKRKITLEQLGFDIGLDKSAIHHIENGKPITLTTLIKIAAVLNVKPSALLKKLSVLNKEDID